MILSHSFQETTPRKLCLTLVSLLMACLSQSGIAQIDASVPPATPAGIMLVEVHREEGSSSDQFLWTRLGDANGRTLFFAQGSVTQGGEFLPVPAGPNSSAFDDWTVVTQEGKSQWAYQGNPLYTWAREQEPGEIAVNVALYGDGPDGAAPLEANRSDALLPPTGWQVARYTPAKSVALPVGIDLRLIDSAQGTVLTDFEGYSLYGFDDGSGEPENACSTKSCYRDWTYLPAPVLAQGLGEFTVIARSDGNRQWAFRGKPLFRYKRDLLPGDVHGRSAHSAMQLALVNASFRPDSVEILNLTGYGDIFTLQDKTLYFGSAFEKYWGGRNLRGSFEIAYYKGKRLAHQACVTQDCLRIWQPFTAADGAQSSGFWEVITRGDGTRQWAYKGFALYTHNQDRVRGDMLGHNLYDIAAVEGDAEVIARTKLLAAVGNASGGAGVYWSVAKP